MPMVEVSNGGTLPESVTLSAMVSYSQGGYALVMVPKVLIDVYTKFALTSGNGYLYRDATSNSVKLSLNTKYNLSAYPFTNWMGTDTASRNYGSISSITLYKD